ncbi:MAG: malto-oligosyltrehalose trehalohydrolase [Desulfosalsimonas sp.]|uniref:malto-oligosyltrehalose trehalohydrolase n=1 Tax=Desulfosalsimonas sp. TaxID=3073848 RepID=UPI003970EC4B
MNRLAVWAPFADSLEAQISGRSIPLEKTAGSWWRLGQPVAPATDYAFVVNNQNPVPDPRSMRQPKGIDGPSQTLDHSAFVWGDDGFQPRPLSSAVIYELHVGTFSEQGTFDGVTGHLDHLLGLGVTHVEIMPVNGFSGSRGWGYDGVNLFAPHEAYGGPEGFKRLVNACHAKGLAVILDVVYNHLGPAGNYLDCFGPYFTDHYQSPWGRAVNLDGAESHEVRGFFCDNAAMWLRDYRVDGLRIDAVHGFFDLSAIHFLEDLRRTADQIQAQTGRHKILIAESDLNDPRTVRPAAAGGHGMDAQWSDDFHHALHAVLTGEQAGYYADFGKLSHIARALTRVFVYDNQFSAFRRRYHGRPVHGLSGHRFLGYLQNHDQVGNRALGERLSRLVSPGCLKTGAALMLLSPFVPMLFQGEEWAASTPFQYFTDHSDPELGEAVKKGRCKEFAAFGWDPEQIPDPQASDTFARCVLKWDEKQTRPHAEILEWYRQLIALRKNLPDAADGRMDRVQATADDTAGWLVMTRGALTVACNLADQTQLVPLSGADRMEIRLCPAKNSQITAAGIELPADCVAVLYQNPAMEESG